MLSRLERDWQGGIGRVTSAMARALALRGHHVHLAGREDRGSEPAADIEGVTLHRWSAATSKLGQAPALLRTLGAVAPDVVHFHATLPHLEPMAAVLLRRARGSRPLVVCTPHTGTRWRKAGWQVRAALRRADLVVVPSAWSGEQAQAAGAPSERVRVVSNGITLPAPGPEGAREPLVFAMGRLVPSKGMDVLLAAFVRIAGQAPGWSLVVGGEGPDRAKLEAAVEEAAVPVRIPGQLGPAPKRELLERAAIGVVPSRADNLPGTLLEMQAHGLAVVASAVGGLTELADGGRAARLVPPADPVALADALLALIASDGSRAQLAEGARKMAAQRAWPVLAEQLEQHYRAALEARR